MCLRRTRFNTLRPAANGSSTCSKLLSVLYAYISSFKRSVRVATGIVVSSLALIHLVGSGTFPHGNVMVGVVSMYVMMYVSMVNKYRPWCPAVVVYRIVSVVVRRYPMYISGAPEVSINYRSPYIYRLNNVVVTIDVVVTHNLHYHVISTLFNVNGGYILINVFCQYSLYKDEKDTIFGRFHYT